MQETVCDFVKGWGSGVGVFCCDRLGWSFVWEGEGAVVVVVGELNVSPTFLFPVSFSYVVSPSQ